MVASRRPASAVIYVIHGGVDPYVAGPTVIGVFLGASIGVADLAPRRRTCAPLPVRRRVALHGVRDADKGRRMTSFDRSIGRLLIAVTYVAGALLFIGVLLMLVEGISPLSGGPRLDLSTIVADVTSLQPAGFLWLGLITVIATPSPG
jgi:hypothetical protein